MLKRGLAQVGQDMPELKPVETRPLPPRTTGVASPVGEAGTIRGGDHASQQTLAAGSPRLKVVGGCHFCNTALTAPSVLGLEVT